GNKVTCNRGQSKLQSLLTSLKDVYSIKRSLLFRLNFLWIMGICLAFQRATRHGNRMVAMLPRLAPANAGQGWPAETTTVDFFFAHRAFPRRANGSALYDG
ncbi:hypothetical protein, partial [Klebsiella pneumoniae]|uniref:hypothetical protein n=1 Tax=Klebsiella pneumoniae TaxID=573 RepID=UPI001C843ED6